LQGETLVSQIDPHGHAPELRHLPHVVVVGAGFGGLSVVKRLAGTAVRITLIDRRNHHLFQPLLYQVATAALSPADIAVPTRAILAGQANATVLLAEVSGIDAAARRVIMREHGALDFDILVLATGAEYSYFGHDDWKTVAPSLKTVEDALGIRRRLLLAFEQAETEEDPAEQQRLLTFVMIGGGPTGVEMAGAIAELARAALVKDFRRIQPAAARIILVEAGPRLLAGFPDRLSKYTAKALGRLGVEVMLNAPVERIDDRAVYFADEALAAATVIWCAGVKATPAGEWLSAETTRSGTVKVRPDLSVPGHPSIFVIGDAADVHAPDGRPLPGVAPVAKQEGEYVARVIQHRVAGRRDPAPFAYDDPGTLATIGRNAAVANFHWIKLTGFPAWLIWGFAHIFYLIGFRNRVLVFVQWIWAWLTEARGARLIIGGPK
jgi:NADH dehydrogenase